MQHPDHLRIARPWIVTFAAAAWSASVLACPTPTDSASRYHLTERLAAAIAAERAKVKADPLSAPVSRVAAADCVGGFAGSYPCNNVDLAAIVPIGEIGGGEGNDIWGWTDPQTGREYALMGRTSGTAFIDVTVPEAPVYLGNLPTQTSSSIWRDVKVYADHAYIVSEAGGHGMQVFDLAGLRGLSGPPQTFATTTHYDGFGAAHNIAINEATGFAYAVGTRNVDDGCAGGLHMVDISTPSAPVFAGCYGGDGYTHDVQCVVYEGPDDDYHDHSAPAQEICFAYNEDTLTIVNATDKANPQLIARRSYAGAGYTHQGWLTGDHRYLLMDDESDELDNGHNTRTYIFDVADLDNPVLLSTYTASTAAIDHNLYVSGNFAFQANYRAGLRIIDLTDIAGGNLSEVGFFDIFPGSDSADFNGAWSLYPYFPSGTVIVSGIEQGLVVLKPGALSAPFSVAAGGSVLGVCGNGSQSINVDIGAANGYTGTVTLDVAGLPAGVTGTFTPATLSPPGTATLEVSSPGGVSGIFPLTITADDGTLSFDDGIALDLADVAPSAADAIMPADTAGGVSALQTLYFAAADGASTYDVDVSIDAAFSDTVVTLAGTQATSVPPPQSGYASATTHYWRVTAKNACGATASPTLSFTTATDDCRLYLSSDVPKSISSVSTDVVTSNLAADPPGIVVDVDVVDVEGVHTWISDLDIRIDGPSHEHGGLSRHPERTTAQLLTQSCGSQDDFDIDFDDESAPGGWPCPPTDGNAYQPATPLAAFDGAGGDGTWTLTVTDHFDADGGSLDNWGVRICTTPASQAPDSDGDGIGDDVDNCRFDANPDQRDTNGDGFGNLCDADLNDDGVVNFADLALLKSVWLADGDLDADLDGNGVVNFGDLARLKAQFLEAPGPGAL